MRPGDVGDLFGGGQGRRSSPAGLLAMMFLAPLGAFVVRVAISRNREFEADRSGAELVGTGEPLARALAKIDRTALALPMRRSRPRHRLYREPAHRRPGGVRPLFATHPPTAERIALRETARRADRRELSRACDGVPTARPR